MTSGVARTCSFGVQLVIVPVIVKYLGRNGYGVLETVTAVATWLTLANGGLTLGLLNALIPCYVSGDRELARRQVTSTLMPLLAIVCSVAVVAAVCVHALPIDRLFHGTIAITRANLSVALDVSVLSTLLTILSGVPIAIYTAYQENHRNNLWDGAGKILVLLAVLSVAHSSFGLIGIVFAVAVAPPLLRVINGIDLLGREKRWLRPRLRDYDPHLFRRSLRQSLVFLFLQSGMIVMLQMDKVVISAMFGATSAADFALVSKVFVMAYSAFSVIHAPLWPGHGEALLRGDLVWVRRMVRLSVGGAIVVAAVCGVAMLSFGDQIMTGWLRTRAHAPASWSLAFAVMFALRGWNDSRSIVLNSAGVLRPQAVFFVAQSVLFILLAIALGHWRGVSGVAWAAPVAAGLTTLWGYPWMMRRYIMKAA